MDIRMGGEVQRRIGAPPEHVYALISDVTRTGEWSPECHRCEWLDGGGQPPTVGDRFRGWNKSGFNRWSRLVEVVAAEPGREFAFRTIPDRVARDSTTWRFRLEPDGDATLVTQSYQLHGRPKFPINVVMRLFLRHHADMRPQMTETLDRLAAVAERASETPVANI